VSPRAAPRGAGPLTVGDAADWLVREAPRLSERGGGRAHYERAISFLVGAFRDLPAAEFRRRHLEVVQRSMADAGLAASTVNRHVTRVRTVWKWAETQEFVPDGRWHHLLTLDGFSPTDPTVAHAPPRKAARWDEVRAVCRVVGPVVRALLLTQWWTGCRTGELVSMRRGDVARLKESWSYRPRTHKTQHLGHARVIPLGPRAYAAARAWLEACEGPDDFVFPAEPARRKKSGPRPVGAYYRDRGYTVFSYAQAVRRACQKLGVSVQPYDLRHAAADRIRRAAGPHAARSVLGQKHLSTTDGYGSALDHEHAAEVQRKIG
jgi:integrase